MRKSVLLFVGLLACQQKQEEKNNTKPDSTTKEVTSQDFYEKPETNFDYRPFCGIYDHESSTTGFSAVLSLKENGHDLYFTLSVSQGNCKKEKEGVVMLIDTSEKFPAGFFQSDDCRLQFTFSQAETKVDVKEIAFCGIEGSACSFEGSYKKRISP